MRFYVETKSRLSDRPGPIDPVTGWPMVHPMLVTDAPSQEAAEMFFELMFPDDVWAVLPMDD